MTNNLNDSLHGLRDLAQAVRRHTALTVAMSITPADGTEQDLLATADRMMVWMEQDAPEAPQAPSFPTW